MPAPKVKLNDSRLEARGFERRLTARPIAGPQGRGFEMKLSPKDARLINFVNRMLFFTDGARIPAASQFVKFISISRATSLSIC